jgi:hypothetical protein
MTQAIDLVFGGSGNEAVRTLDSVEASWDGLEDDGFEGGTSRERGVLKPLNEGTFLSIDLRKHRQESDD